MSIFIVFNGKFKRREQSFVKLVNYFSPMKKISRRDACANTVNVSRQVPKVLFSSVLAQEDPDAKYFGVTS